MSFLYVEQLGRGGPVPESYYLHPEDDPPSELTGYVMDKVKPVVREKVDMIAGQAVRERIETVAGQLISERLVSDTGAMIREMVETQIGPILTEHVQTPLGPLTRER